MRRVALAVAPLALLVTFTAVTTSASATGVGTVAVAAHPETPGIAASYVISFTPATNLNNGTISVVAAPGTTFSPCNSSCANYTIAQGGSYKNYSNVVVEAANGSSTTNEFVATLVAMSMISGGTPVTVIAQGLNPPTGGTDSASVWTSNNTSPVSAPYTIGTPGFGLIQGAIPNHMEAPQLDLASPAFLQTLFGTPTQTMPTLASAYLPSGKWTQMDGANGSLGYLQQDGWSAPGYQLVIGVPIVPSQNIADVTLEGGANGDYNQYFRQLASSLINEGLGNAWLRLGYEFDNQGMAKSSKPWGTSNNTTQEGYFAQYFRQIVTTMRAVPGSNFRFIWNPDGFAFLGNSDPEYLSSGGFSLLPAWPGSQYVDFIGADVYDVEPSVTTGYTQAQNWATFINPQIQAAAQFASNEGVPLAFPEWGVMSHEPPMAGMGDDPGFINGMYCFMTNPADHVAWESYTNANYVGWNSQITGSSFPASLAAFQQDFGQGSTSACSSG